MPDPSFPSGQVNIQFQVDRPQHRTAWNYHYVACALEDDGHAIIDTRRFFMHSVQHVSMFRRAVIMGDHPEWGTLALTVEGYDMIQLPKDGQAR